MLKVGNVGPTIVRAYGAESVEGSAPYHTFFLERYAEAYRLELAAFVEAVHGRPSTSPGFEDGRAALILADAAERSAAEGVSIAVDLKT